MDRCDPECAGRLAPQSDLQLDYCRERQRQGHRRLLDFGSYLLNNGVYSSSAVEYVALSPSGRYAIGSNLGNYSLTDLNANTQTPLPAPATWVAVANNGTVLGYNSSGTFLVRGNATTYLPSPSNSAMTPTAISPDGSVVVGMVFATGNGFIWTAQSGTRNFGSALAEQAPGHLPVELAVVDRFYPEAVTVTGGVATVAGMFQPQNLTPLTAFVATLRTSMPGLPIDLSGAYMAVKNSVVSATTDPNGTVGGTHGQQVLEPAPAFVSAPFSNQYRPPTPLSGVNMTGHSYWFDVDLGSAVNWPNPSSTQNWFAGQAAIGEDGAELQIRASHSTANGIDTSTNNGLLIDFYRKDGRFWAHVTNLWYDQDVNIPAASDGSKYHVNVSLAAGGAVTITFTLENGMATAGGSSPAATVTLAGGSTRERPERPGAADSSTRVSWCRSTT